MYSLKQHIFGFFGRHAKRSDTYKDVEGKGIWERYNESIGEDYDEEIGLLVDNYVDNLVNPQKAEPKFIPYLEGLFGGLVKVYDDIAYRRRVLNFATQIFKVKGTKKSYDILLKMAGFTSVTIHEDFGGGGFDSPVTLDDVDRRFDQGTCPNCINYSIELDGDLVLTQELKEIIYNIVRFVEPIDARLNGITYDGVDVIEQVVSFRKDEDGNLYFDNTGDPTLTVRVENGRLYIDGPNKGKYQIDVNGNIKYIG